MTSGAFWSSLWNMLLHEEHFRQGFLEEMKENTDEKTLYTRISLLLGHLPSPDQTSDCRKFLQEMGDERLLMYTLKRVQEKLKTLSLQADPGINDIDKVDISILQLYDVHHVKNRLSVSEEVRNTAIVTLQPIRGFLEGWLSFQGAFNLGSFHGFRAFISSTLVQDLMLTLSLIIWTMDNMDQHQMLERMAFLNFHYLFWFNAFGNDPKFHEPLLRGMALSIVFWILMGSDHIPTGPQTFKQIVQNRVGPNQLHDGVAHIFANILTRSLQHHKDESIMVYHEFFDIIGRMGYLDVFVDRLGMFIQQYRTTQFFNQTKETLGVLIEQIFEHMPEDACWTSFVDHARMFLLAEDRFLEKLNKSSESCLRSLLDRARTNLVRDDEPELLYDTSEFLLLQPVKGRWDQSLRSLIIDRLKKALSDDSAADAVLQKQFPLLPLLEQCTTWLDPTENLGVAFIPFGQRLVERLGQYFANQFHPAFPVKTLLDIADQIFSTGDFNTFVDALIRKLTEIMPAVNEERYKECFAPFIQKPLVRSAVHKDRIEEIAKNTVQQGLQPRLVLFLRDILHAYRSKQKRKWKDTVGLRNNIQNLRQRGDLSEEIEQMLSDIEEMIR